MDYHIIINMNDAIEIARFFRKRGFIWVRRHSGYWWVYDGTLIHHRIMQLNNIEPGLTVNISQVNIIEAGKMIMIDKDKMRQPLQFRVNPKFECPPFTVLGTFGLRWGNHRE